MTIPASNTPNAIIADAYEDAALIQEGQTLNGEQLAKGMRRLRDVLMFFQTKGLKLFLLADTAVPLTAGQNQYTFMPGGSVSMQKPMRVLQGYYLYTATNVRRPITVLSYNEYLTLGQSGILTANQGPISQYFVEKLVDRLRVTFWLCPDTNEASLGQAHVLLQTQATTITQLNDEVQFPEEWRMALRWGLAHDLATGQPKSVIDRCAQNAETYRVALEDWDVEDAPTIFQVDMRTYGNVGQFR